MDQNEPPIRPGIFLLKSAFERTSADIDPPPKPRNPRDGPSLAVYYRSEEEVRDGFMIALRAMGLAGAGQHEPATPPVTVQSREDDAV